MLPGAHEQQQHILDLVAKYPWLSTTGIAGHLPQYVTAQQQWLAQYYALAEFTALNADRPDPLTILVQKMTRETQVVKTLPEEELARLREGVLKTVRGMWPSDEDSPLDRAIDSRLRALSLSDPRKIVVGLISILPSGKEALFRLGSVEAQLERLEADRNLTDELISGTFNASVHQLSERMSKAELIARVRELLQLEGTLVPLLRAKWCLYFLARSLAIRENLEDGNVGVVEKWIRGAPDAAFDISQGDSGLVEQFAGGLRRAAAGTGDRGPSEAYVERLMKTLKSVDHVSQKREVAVGKDLFTIVEILPELGVFRGVLGGDCSTSHSYAFPFSPLERVYVMFENKEDPIRAYISGTLLTAGGKPTFYVHDIAGPGLTIETQARALHALYQVRDAIGAQQLTLPSQTVREANAGQEPSQSPQITALIQDLNRYVEAQPVHHHYRDKAVRKFLGGLPNSGSDYDSPEFNAEGFVFVPRKEILGEIQAKIVGSKKERDAGVKEELGREEAFLRLLDLLAGEEQPDMFFDDLGFGRQEVERILGVVNNAAQKPLAKYYAAMREEFAGVGIELTEKFIRKHARYFVLGHLRAKDATSTDDEDLLARTVQYTMETVKRGRVRQFAYDLIARYPDFFNRDEKFREYVSAIPLRGADNLERVDLLLKAGVDPRLITLSSERVVNIAKGSQERLMRMAIEWSLRSGTKNPTPETLLLLARALKNEKHESDETSLAAVRALMEIRTDDEEVISSLTDSVKHDENVEIAYSAAVALTLNGVRHKKAQAILTANGKNAKIPARLRERGNQLVGGGGAIACRDEVADSEEE